MWNGRRDGVDGSPDSAVELDCGMRTADCVSQFAVLEF